MEKTVDIAVQAQVDVLVQDTQTKTSAIRSCASRITDLKRSIYVNKQMVNHGSYKVEATLLGMVGVIGFIAAAGIATWGIQQWVRQPKNRVAAVNALMAIILSKTAAVVVGLLPTQASIYLFSTDHKKNVEISAKALECEKAQLQERLEEAGIYVREKETFIQHMDKGPLKRSATGALLGLIKLKIACEKLQGRSLSK